MQPIWFIQVLLYVLQDSPLRMIYFCPSFLLKIISQTQCSTPIPFQSFMKTSQTILEGNDFWGCLSFEDCHLIQTVIFCQPFAYACEWLDRRTAEGRSQFLGHVTISNQRLWWLRRRGRQGWWWWSVLVTPELRWERQEHLWSWLASQSGLVSKPQVSD